MPKEILEPISNRYASVLLPISFRGSLAAKYYSLKILGGNDVTDFIEKLLTTTNPEVIRYHDGKNIVIGLRSDKGRFFPDW